MYKICHLDKFPFINKDKLIDYIDVADEYDVSEKARSNNQFVDNFINNNIDNYWCKKRYSFLSRQYASFKKNPTFRRYISLIMWAYDPYDTDIIIKNKDMWDNYIE
jgi:hypothetical protein